MDESEELDDFTKTTPAEVVLIVEECKESVTIAEWACKAIANFTNTAIKTRNREAMAQLLDEGICECLMSTMLTHCAESLIVATDGCHALCDLTQSDRELREFLGDLGACELCVFMLNMHIGRPEVTEGSSKAMINLCTENIKNSFRLSEAGACEVLVQAGNFGFNLRHPQCASVAANVCDAISHLCEAANQAKLADSGACDLVVSLFKFHLDNDIVCEPATKALCGLSSLTAENREVLGKSGGCLLIVQAMQQQLEHNEENRPFNIQIVENCAEAMMHMALSVSNTERFSQADGCTVLMKVLDKFLIERNFGAEICCGGLMNMITYGTSSKENIQCMRDANIVELMARVQISTRSSYRARDNASQLVTYVNATNTPLGALQPPSAIRHSSLNAPSSSPMSSTSKTNISKSANSTPRAGTASSFASDEQKSQSQFFASFSSFAEKGRRSLGNLSSGAISSNSNTKDGSNSSPLHTIFNSLFENKINSNDRNTANSQTSEKDDDRRISPFDRRAQKESSKSDEVSSVRDDSLLARRTSDSTQDDLRDSDDKIYEI